MTQRAEPATARPAAPPPFLDVAGCEAWRARLPLLNPPLAQRLLLEALEALNHTALPVATRWALAECLQAPVRFVQSEVATLFAGKPLPLSPLESEAIERTHAVWQALVLSYRLCLDAAPAAPPLPPALGAQLCARALALLAEDLFDWMRAGHVATAGWWRLAHGLMAKAETLGVLALEVEDPWRDEAQTTPARITPAQAYVELALLATASLHELPPEEQRCVQQWARRWSAKVAVLRAPPELASALPLCVDLDADAPPGYLPVTGPGARWLDTRQLQRSLHKRLTLLTGSDDATLPARLGLGTGCPLAVARALLERLYPRWTKGGVRRRYVRHPMSGPCALVIGFPAAHETLAGLTSFRPPTPLGDAELRRQREAIALFERLPSPLPVQGPPGPVMAQTAEHWAVVEDWGLLDRSAEGLCLVRPLAQDGERIASGRLVAAQPAGSPALWLAVVRWCQRRGDQLVAGIQLFPGQAWPVAVRRTGVMAVPDPYRPAFVLASGAEAAPETHLVLAPGSFKAERILEVWTAVQSRRYKLLRLVERGIDFERVVCVEVDGGASRGDAVSHWGVSGLASKAEVSAAGSGRPKK